MRHRHVERVAAHNLVHVRRRDLTWVNQRVDSVDDYLRAPEAQHRHAVAAAETLWEGVDVHGAEAGEGEEGGGPEHCWLVPWRALGGRWVVGEEEEEDAELLEEWLACSEEKAL